MDNNSPELDTIFLAFADSTRRAVLRRLGDGPASVSDLAAPFDMALPPFMKHIRTLENAGLITTEKVGRVRTCELNPEKYAAVEDWLKEQRQQWASRYRKLDQLLKQLKEKDK
ncbi:DNA-binding transcriptional regulator, ArsR family [Poseidonocella pacifica]|uniref:DNA-binding transcriptional regulator, ArsR family n=1 Tax=Poseidonocella pacifica TaxID=871651 RepID=A0A1I0WSN7_9RHOB|nr:metalloregulator ArsR/SmtB family transcription factor [Poseidonocella pacifica]SFA91779.1 DNA-binding transcriptional regulator, ArsR family [Poseidonocella pacifica]